MFRFTQPKDNAVAITTAFLKAIHAKVSDETIEETLKSHPDYPSLLSVSDSLNEWKIENVSAKISPEQLIEVPKPFLAYLTGNGGMFALVKKLNNNIITWLHSEKGWQIEKIDEFTKKWQGIVLMAEANENSIEPDFAQKFQKQRLEKLRVPLIFGGLVFLILVSFYLASPFLSWQLPALLCTNLSGTIISSLLLWQSIDKNNPFIKNLCQVGTKANCNSILNSKAAQVSSWLSWSEVGFFYFAGGFLALLSPLAPEGGIQILKVFSFLALPYTLWSVYYQGFVVKQWCTLCLSIQILIVVEFVIFLNYPITFNLQNSPIGAAAVAAGGAFGVVVLFWVFLKPLMLKSQQMEPLKNDLRRFKNNPNLFLALLQKQTQMPPVSNDLGAIILGNPEAEHTLTMVTNPFCNPCANIHKDIEKLLETNQNLRCQVIFAATNDENDKRGQVARLVLSANNQAEALNTWYENEERSIEIWQKQLAITEVNEVKKILERQQSWCETAKIMATPTLYFDGYQLPELYRLKDIKMIVNYLPTEDFREINIV